MVALLSGSSAIGFLGLPAPSGAMLSKNKRCYEPETLEPRRRLRRNIQDLVATNALPMNRIGEVARDVHRIDQGSSPDIAKTKQSTKNESRNLIGKFSKASTWMPVYWAQVRCLNPKTEELKHEWLAFNAIHEIVHVLQRLGTIEKSWKPRTWIHSPSSTLRHARLRLILSSWAWGSGVMAPLAIG